MCSSSPNRFAVNTFIPRQWAEGDRPNGTGSLSPATSSNLASPGKRAGKREPKGSRPNPEETTGCRRRRRRICCAGCRTPQQQREWTASSPVKTLVKLRGRRRTRDQLLHAASHLHCLRLHCKQEGISEKVSAAGSPRGSTVTRKRGNNRGFTERSVSGHRTRMPFQGDAKVLALFHTPCPRRWTERKNSTRQSGKWIPLGIE
jgi:hypothetical protein